MTKAELKAERVRLGLSRHKMAERLGLSVRTISYYEKGEVPIPMPVTLLVKALRSLEIAQKNLALAEREQN